MSNFIENPTNKTEDILTALNIFTAKEIAAKFKHLGIKGRQHNALCCPLSIYLEDKTGRYHKVTGNGYIVYDAKAGWLTGELPKFVRKFVKRFDKGKYPELIDDSI